MPRFDYLDLMNREEFHLPTSKDITEFFHRKSDLDDIPYTFIENPSECCCYVQCKWSDLKEEVCQYIHLTNSRYRIKFRYVILLQGFRIRCCPGFTLPSPDTLSDAKKLYVKLKAVQYDCGFVVQVQCVTPKREKQISRTNIASVFGVRASPNIKDGITAPCCGVMCCWGQKADIDIDGLVTLTAKLDDQDFELHSHPSLVTEWCNEDLHPNNILYVFLKKLQFDTYNRIQIWNLQYFPQGKCKKVKNCDCSLCKKYLSPTSTFCKGLMTDQTSKTDVYYIRNGLVLSCKSENVIYLITCIECGLQYVGRSKCRMQMKLNDHVDLFNIDDNVTNHHHNKQHHHRRKLLYSHFLHEHASENPLDLLSVVIIDQIASKQNNTSINKLRQYWINKLDTFDHGLNGKIPTTTPRTLGDTFHHKNLLQTKTTSPTCDENNNMIVKRFLEGLET